VILATTLLALAPALPAQEASSQGPVWALQPTHVVMPDGSTAEGQTVLVQNGRILGVGADLELPSGARRWKLEGVLAPGFVDAFSAYGMDQPAQEDSRALTPMLRAFDAIDLASDDWKKLIEAGVTSIQVLPEPNNIQAGWGALVASSGESRMLAGRTRQVLSMVVSRVGDSSFGPSSLVGAIELLGKADSARIPGVAERGVLAHVDDAAAIRAVREALGKDIQTSWMMWGDPASYGGELKGQVAGMPIPGVGAWTPRGLETLKRLNKAGCRDSRVTPRLQWLRSRVTPPLSLVPIKSDPSKRAAAPTSCCGRLIRWIRPRKFFLSSSTARPHSAPLTRSNSCFSLRS